MSGDKRRLLKQLQVFFVDHGTVGDVGGQLRHGAAGKMIGDHRQHIAVESPIIRRAVFDAETCGQAPFNTQKRKDELLEIRPLILAVAVGRQIRFTFNCLVVAPDTD